MSGAATPSRAGWDFDAKKLTLRVETLIEPGTPVEFTFTVKNPDCEQMSPPVPTPAPQPINLNPIPHSPHLKS